MKFGLSIFCLVACLSLAASYSSSWGRRNRTDYLLLSEQVVRLPRRNNYWDVNVDYPRRGQGNSRTITAINLIDRFTNSSGPYGTLIFGGPGWKQATVNIRSQLGRGINSTVEFWGK